MHSSRLRNDFDGPAVDDQGLVARLDRGVEAPVRRIILQEHAQRLDVRQVVDGHDLEIVSLVHRAEHVPPDPAEPVDAYTNRHSFPPF